MNNKPTLRIDSEHARNGIATTGVMTYWDDFEKIVVPKLYENFEILEDNITPSKFFLSFHKVIFDRKLPGDLMARWRTRVVRILHIPSMYHVERVYEHERMYNKFITHYEQLDKRMKGLSGIKASAFIPMSIDTEKLPQNNSNKKGIIYFGNITTTKTHIYRELKKSGIKFDTLSLSALNPVEQPNGKKYSFEECLEIVSGYEIGIGVGRAALEMIAMGLKVIIAGRHYSGPILNQKDFEMQWKSNCNSDVGITGVINFEKDVNKIREAEAVDPLQVDMRNFASKYVEEIINFTEK